MHDVGVRPRSEAVSRTFHRVRGAGASCPAPISHTLGGLFCWCVLREGRPHQTLDETFDARFVPFWAKVTYFDDGFFL